MTRLAALFATLIFAGCAESARQTEPNPECPACGGENQGSGGGGDRGSGGAQEAAGAPSGGVGGALDGPVPYVIVTAPELGETNVYPAPLFDGNGEEFVLELAFSERMRPHEAFALAAHDHTRTAHAEWSEDDASLRLVVRSSVASPRPLVDDTEYRLDASKLESAAGVPVDANVRLRDGELVFRTGRYDTLLNHSCGHTFFGPFASASASASADTSAPDIGTTHTEYSIALLPDDAGTFGGFVRAQFLTAGPYRLYFDGVTPVTRLTSPETAGELASLRATPRACPGITHELTLPEVTPGEDLFLFIGPQATSTRRVIVELVPSE